MTNGNEQNLAEIKAPWGKELKLLELDYEGDLAMVRLRIREGRRFTDLDLDPDTAQRLGHVLLTWAEANRG